MTNMLIVDWFKLNTKIMLLAIPLFMPGGTELILLVFVVLLLFGGKKIPELMKGLGKGIREFNSAKATIETEIKEGMKEPKVKPKTPEKLDDDIV